MINVKTHLQMLLMAKQINVQTNKCENKLMWKHMYGMIFEQNK